MSKQHEDNACLTQHNCDSQNGITMKNISELFPPSATTKYSGKFFLIEGAPGIGKTILSKEIAYQWASNNLLQYKRHLLLIYLRNINSSKLISVEKLVQHVLQSEAAAADLGKYLIQTSGKDLVVVLDGYDELSEADRKNSFISNLIRRQVLSKCLLVITSRPSASLPLRDIADCRIEVVGFTEEDRLDYINSALLDSPEKVTALQDYLQSNPTINALCYIPLNMTILLCLSENGISHLPETQTEMYRKFIEMTVIRFLEKMGENISDSSVFNLEILPHPHDVVFKELSRFAFEALKCDKLVFKLTEIQEICPSLTAVSSNWNGLGLLNSFTYIEDGSKTVTYHFLHFSIQEYMAAYHISTLPDKKQLKLLKNTFWSVEYYNTWMMYVGITDGRTFPLKHFLSGNFFQIFTWLFKINGISKTYLNDKIKYLHIFQCLAEAPGSNLLLSFGTAFQSKEIDLSNQTLLPKDLNTLGFFLIRSTNKHWKKLNLSRCNMGSAGLKILFEWFVGKEFSMVTIDSIDLSYNQLGFSSLVGLLNLVKTWKTTQFISVNDFVHDNETACDIFEAVEHVIFQSSDVVMLKTLLIGSFLFAYKLNENEILWLPANAEHIKITSLYLNSCDISSKLLDNTIVNYSNISSLCLHILNCQLELSSIISLQRFTLRELLIHSANNITSDDVETILSTCQHHTSVVVITMDTLGACNPTSKQLAIAQKQEPSVTSLKLFHCNLNSDTSKQIATLLTSSNSLDELKFVGCDIDNSEIEILGNHLITERHIFNIKKLHISSSKLALLALAKVVSIPSVTVAVDESKHLFCDSTIKILLSISTISELHIKVSNVTEKMIDDMTTVILNNKKLRIFDFVSSNIQTMGMAKIAKALRNLSSLTELNVGLNNITEEAADDIAAVISNNSELRILKLSHNRFQSAGITMIARALQNISSLHESRIDLNDTTEKSADDIAAVKQHRHKLHILDLGGNNLKAAGMKKIAKVLQNISSLSLLKIENNYITEKAADDIAAAILHNNVLQILDLGGNNLEAAGTIKIAKALKNISSLTLLNMEKNNITEKAADDIATVILHNNKMQLLNLGENNLEAAGTIKIAKALQNISLLTLLNIEKNNITEEAADDIAAVIMNNNKLQSLNFSKNMFKATGMIKIAKVLQTISSLYELNIGWNKITEEAADDIAAAIVSNSKLQKLVISGNTFQTVGIIKIANSLQCISSLSELYMNSMHITEEEADDIAACIPNNSNLKSTSNVL